MYINDGIVYAGGFKENIKITNVKITAPHMMLLTFSTGEKRVFDATVLSGTAFSPLQDEKVFENYELFHGVITWLDGQIDCAPEYMYQHSYSYTDTVTL